MHEATQSFLGSTHKMAEIRQNGRLQDLASAIRIALVSLISLPSLPLFSLVFFFLFLPHEQGFTDFLECSH